MALYKNTASQRVAVFAFNSSTGAKVTGDASNITAKIQIDNGTSATTNDANPTEANATNHPGVYYFDLTQAETNGNCIVISAVSGTSNVVLDPVVVYPNDAASYKATTPSNFSSLAINGSGHVSRVTLCDTVTTTSDMRGTDSGATAANLATVDTVVDGIQTDLSNGTDGLGALKALIDTVDTVADAIKVVTDALPNSGSLSSLATAANLATVDTVVDGIQTDLSNGTDGLGALKTLIDTVDTVVDAVKAKTDQLTFTVSNQVDSNALSAALTVAAIADGVWDEVQSGHTTSGTFGKYLDAQVSTVSAPTAAAVADAVWDEAISGHAVAGSTGATLSSAGSAGDPWTTAIPGSYTSSQAGYILGTTVVNSLANDAIVYVNPSTAYDLELIRGDAYDGTSHAKLSFPAGQDIAGVACTLTVRNADTDASLINIDGVGVGSNAVITLTSAQTVDLVPGIQKFDVEVEHSGTSKQTVARGECIVLEDQTR